MNQHPNVPQEMPPVVAHEEGLSAADLNALNQIEMGVDPFTQAGPFAQEQSADRFAGVNQMLRPNASESLSLTPRIAEPAAKQPELTFNLEDVARQAEEGTAFHQWAAEKRAEREDSIALLGLMLAFKLREQDEAAHHEEEKKLVKA